jgi:hypothetical protein
VYSGFSHYDRQLFAKVSQVNDPNAAWVNQQPHWMLIEDLMGGTYEIRRRHRRYLPQEPRELDESYDRRLSTSICPPYYQRLERMLAGMLTRKPVRLNDTSDQIREQLFNVDLAGADLNVWTYETARKMIRYGHVGVLVDAPRDGGRPYWSSYTPRDILGYRTEVIDGEQRLTQLRLSETVILPDGEYGEKQVQQVRVLTPGEFKVFQQDEKKGDFRIVDEGRTSLNRIPFAVAYANKVGTFESRPPLEDIAQLNLKSYQIQSDLDNQLHISAVPMLAFFGFPSAAEEVTAGPGEAIAFPADGRAEYISPPSDAFKSLFERLQQIEHQINELGLSAVLGQKLSAETAEAKRIDRSQGDSTMMVIAQNMQDMIDNCLQYHAEFLGDRQPGSSYVNRDFLGTRLEPQEIQALLQLYTAGTITQETLLMQLSEGEVLGDDFDVDGELEATQAGGLIDVGVGDMPSGEDAQNEETSFIEEDAA